MSIRLIAVPYDLGHYGVDMGSGPLSLLESGIDERLRYRGADVDVLTIEADDLPDHEVGAAFRLNGLLADAVRDAVSDEAFPLVLAGNCNACIGALAGLDPSRLGAIWLDAHGDFHTPETTASGYFDGFALNIAVGRSWVGMARAVPGFTPLPEDRVVLAGTRNLDAGEEQAVGESSMIVCNYDQIRAGGEALLGVAFDTLRERVSDVYLHLDLDVLDPAVAPINQFAPRGGLALSQLLETITAVADRFRIAGAVFASYHPAVDPDGDGRAAYRDAIMSVAAAVDGWRW